MHELMMKRMVIKASVALCMMVAPALSFALEQAKTKEYGNPWLDSTLPVFHVGVNYDPEKRGIDDPLVEAWDRAQI